jgi:2-methylcitrate dehydratase
MDRTAEAFVAFAHELKFSGLSHAAIHAVKRSVIDSIGCAFGAFNADASRALRHLASQVTATKPATVIGTNIRTVPDYAALTNGAMIRYLDYSDDYFGGAGDIGPHPSDNISGVLAAAESAGADGHALILGIVIAYEACAQLTDRVNHGGVKPTWDYTTLHAISTSLGAGRVLGLTREQLRDALALATVSNITLLQTRHGELSNWKGIAGPNGSRGGLFAAMLAREGITGPDAPFEGKAGWMKHLKMPFELGPLGGGGRPFKVEGIYYKFIPIRYSAQLMVWVALELREKVDIADMASICVCVPKRYVTARADAPEHWNPTTRETTDHSFPFLIAAALIDGAINERTFTPECFRDPAILALADKVTMAEDPEFSKAFPQDYKVRFDVTMKSGDVVKVQQANSKGHPRNPMSDAEIEEKFLHQADAVLPREQSRALLTELWQLEKQSRLGRLFELMRIP